MRKVTLYIECSSTYIGKKPRLSGYVLEYITHDLPVTGQAFREGSGTYNQEYLLTIADALGHMKEPVELLICGSNRFVLNMLRDRLQIWAENDFISNDRPVMNQEEWRSVWEKIKEHKVNIQIGKHSYSGWLLTEMEDRNGTKENERTKRSTEMERGHEGPGNPQGSETGRGPHGSDLPEAGRLSGGLCGTAL